ncbi:hypothetical protein M758_3G067600 [Ceratodon purpureus]|uniref:RWP-RK domain-containing protein n=1 Tax=Ceratodon purpureus TaxID=3225 RepID=A0A8T0IHQ6_CERPU|nr:hypothetical protein KC19_3G068100 [Ceratodon purpureus]KAG0622048.1 hypothetical protein M758_3G067600 [Ceratodon purpureus]
MAGGQLDSPTCEGVVVNASNSPRFDINEFLKTPKDANAEEQFFNFATFNIPAPPCNLLTPLPPFNNRRSGRGEGGPESDFSALLFDSKGIDGEVAYADDTLNGELIAFDEIDADIAKDSFALFSGSHDSYMNNPPMSPVRLEVPSYVPSSGNRLPSMACPPTIFTAGSYMVGDLGLVDVEDRAFVSMEHGASTSGGTHQMNCCGNSVDWGLTREGPMQPKFGQSHNQQYQCASCQILRRIIHSNGVQDTKLEIHGCDGQSYHAVLQTRFCIDDGFPASFEQQMVEFPVGNAEYVKQFLLQYSLLRRKEGFVLRHDSLASHGSGGLGMGMSSERIMGANTGCLPKQMGHMVLPDGLCTSSDFSNSGCAYGKAGHGQNKLHRSGSIDSTDNADVTVGPAKPPKSNAAAQRERTGKLKMTDLAQHFHLPINAAAKELGICPTVLKKICRRNGMRRWPHRKIKSIERIIATLEQTIAEGAGQGDEGIRMEIAMLRNERAQLCAGFLGET